MFKKFKVLHITPHLGGGVGRVLLNYLQNVQNDSDFLHEVACLDYANENAIEVTSNIGIIMTDRMSYNIKKLHSMITEADIVLIHWWNHPLLYAFLVKEILPPARIIFWSHISGFHPPYVFNKTALNYPDIFVFTTPLSLETPEVKSLSEERHKYLRVIWSTGGIKHVESIKRKPHVGFKIGYVGTVDYCKMHPDFVKISSKINIPDVQFIVCGGSSEAQIQKETLQYGTEKRFVFTGQVNNITDYLSEFDVFGYPLAPYHYGTCEQSLCESMAAGIPPVVLANKTEKYIVEDGITGIVAKNEREYINGIKNLYNNLALRKLLSSNAKKVAKQRFSMELMVNKWTNVFNEILTFPKITRKWKGKYNGKSESPANLFLESLGNYDKPFLAFCYAYKVNDKIKTRNEIVKMGKSPIWQARTRGTVHHYNHFFPGDFYLEEWSKLMTHSEKRSKYVN